MHADEMVRNEVARERDELVALRRELHAMPELGFQEAGTAGVVAERLRAAGLDVQTGVGRTGIVAVLEGTSGTGRAGAARTRDRRARSLAGRGEGRTLMVRADMDGLPVGELTGLPFASTNNRMHACGHDGHMAMAVGAAETLARMRPRFRGRVVFVFQPAEEVVQGALAMLADGLFETHRPDRVIGLHLWNQMPAGRVFVNRGTVFASADAFRLTVTGKGGHGALPHLSADPVVAAAQVVSAVQTVVSREVPPNEMGVVTFGQVHGGSAPNVIADYVVMEGTVRAYRSEVRQKILEAVPRIASGVASGLRCETRFEHLYGAPPVINNPGVADWVAGHAAATVGEENVSDHEPVSVGDDMAEFLNRAPGCYFLLGAGHPGAAPHHNARFDFDEVCLPVGTEIFVRAALDFLG
jgi:amidohydrolase